MRQTFTYGPANSGMRLSVVQNPHRADELIQNRLAQLATNMRTTLAAMESTLRRC